MNSRIEHEERKRKLEIEKMELENWEMKKKSKKTTTMTAIILIIVSLFFWPLFIVSIPYFIIAMIESMDRNVKDIKENWKKIKK